MVINHEIFSMVFLLNADSRGAVVSYKRKLCGSTGYLLSLSLPRKIRLTDRLDMTIAVDWDVNKQTLYVTNIF